MKGLILIFVLLSGISSAIAQEKLWLDKNYQWTDDSIQAVRYALVSKINKRQPPGGADHGVLSRRCHTSGPELQRW